MIERALLLIFVVALAAPPVRAEDPREARARAHFEVGLGMYHLANYADAAREFSAGYELSHRPQFLVNLGQTYRKLGDFDKAAEMFKHYLAVAPPDAHDRKDVQDILEEVERARATQPSPSVAPVTPPPSVAALAAPPSPPKRSMLRRVWWTIPAGAIVVGAVVGVAVYFSLPSQLSCSSASIGCYDVRR